MRPRLASAPLRPTLGAWGAALPAGAPREVGSAVGLKPHLRMLRNVSALRACVRSPLTHPLLACLVCLEEAGRNQTVRLRGGGAPESPRGLLTPISLSFPPPSPFPSCLPL